MALDAAPAIRHPAPGAAPPRRSPTSHRQGATVPHGTGAGLARFTIALMNDGIIPAAPNSGIAVIEPAALQLAVRYAGAKCRAPTPRDATSAERAQLAALVGLS